MSGKLENAAIEAINDLRELCGKLEIELAGDEPDDIFALHQAMQSQLTAILKITTDVKIEKEELLVTNRQKQPNMHN